jgi:hypothetical protein
MKRKFTLGIGVVWPSENPRPAFHPSCFRLRIYVGRQKVLIFLKIVCRVCKCNIYFFLNIFVILRPLALLREYILNVRIEHRASIPVVSLASANKSGHAWHKIKEKLHIGLRGLWYTLYVVETSSKTYPTTYLIYSPPQIGLNRLQHKKKLRFWSFFRFLGARKGVQKSTIY